MTAYYGPQTPQIEALLVRVGGLSRDEITRLVAGRGARQAATRDAVGEAAWYAARAAWAANRDAAETAVWYAARGADWATAWAAPQSAAWAANRDAAETAAWLAAWATAWDAAVALVVRDLIGQHGFTQEHYDTLVAPWAEVVGKAHPDD